MSLLTRSSSNEFEPAADSINRTGVCLRPKSTPITRTRPHTHRPPATARAPSSTRATPGNCAGQRMVPTLHLPPRSRAPVGASRLRAVARPPRFAAPPTLSGWTAFTPRALPRHPFHCANGARRQAYSAAHQACRSASRAHAQTRRNRTKSLYTPQRHAKPTQAPRQQHGRASGARSGPKTFAVGKLSLRTPRSADAR